MNAQRGHRLVEVRCRCHGAVLVLASMADAWTCPVCHRGGHFGRLYVVGADLQFRELPPDVVMVDEEERSVNVA